MSAVRERIQAFRVPSTFDTIDSARGEGGRIEHYHGARESERKISLRKATVDSVLLPIPSSCQTRECVR